MRDSQLKALRPAIPTIHEAQSVSIGENFQNRTLRPVLKLQNDLLVALLKHYFEKRKNTYYQLAADRRAAYIEHSVRKDLRFRNLLLGTIIGQFTAAELETYLENEADVRRRLVSLLVQRFVDQLSHL